MNKFQGVTFNVAHSTDKAIINTTSYFIGVLEDRKFNAYDRRIRRLQKKAVKIRAKIDELEPVPFALTDEGREVAEAAIPKVD